MGRSVFTRFYMIHECDRQIDRHHTMEYRVTTCLENLEMSGNLTAVTEMSGILLKIRDRKSVV